MSTPANKTELLNWAVTTERIPAHMRPTWAARFVLDDPAAVERALIAQRPSDRYRTWPVPRAWASVAASVGPGEPAPEPTDYPSTWLRPDERNVTATGRIHHTRDN